MILPLRKTVPWDSLPLSRAAIAAGAVVKNTATGLNIPAGTVIAAGDTYYQTADFVLCEGYDLFSLVAFVTVNPGASDVSVSAIPVSVVDPTQQLDAIGWGSITVGSGYSRISQAMPNVFGFYLRFAVVGGFGGTIQSVLELTMSKS